MSRFLIGLTLLVASSSLLAVEKPNLIFILTDDQRDDSFASMGHPWVETPHIDALLARSMRFENAYIAEPTCRPSRAALLLGNHERVNLNGFSSNHKTTAAQWADSYPELLRRGGYQTGYVGKWHVNLDGLNLEEMFDFWDGHNGHGPFYFERTLADGTETVVTTNRHHTDNALRFLREERNEKPFCLSLSYATPHGSKVRSMHKDVMTSASENPHLQDHPIYGGKYRELEISYPQQKGENPYDHIPREVMDQDKGRNSTYAFSYDPVSGKEHQFRYYQMITELDEMVGELIAELEAKELSDKTLIIFGSDHGLLMGEYGMGGKGLLYDLTAKFPCFIYDPAAPEAMRGQSNTKLVSSLDIPVTLLDYAGVAPGPHMSGRSLKPLVHGTAPETPWRDGLFLENMYTGRDTPLQEGYVDGSWKYIRCYKLPHPFEPSDVDHHRGEPVYEMLFSLEDDPEEKINRASDPEWKAKLEELRSKCDEDLRDLLEERTRYAKTYGLE